MNKFFLKTTFLLSASIVLFFLFSITLFYAKKQPLHNSVTYSFLGKTALTQSALFRENSSSRFLNGSFSKKPYNSALFEVNYSLKGWSQK